MDDLQRRVRIAAAIAGAARGDGTSVGLCHVCRAAVVVVGVAGASVSVLGDLGFVETVCATDATSEHAAELETILGVGPAVDAVRHGDPMLVADVGRQSVPDRWPRLDAVLAPLGVLGLFAFPLVVGGGTVGVLELYRRRPGALTGCEVADAQVFAEAAVDRLVKMGTGELGCADDLVFGPLDAQWAMINQAVGIVSVQLSSGLSDAYLRLRAYALLSGCRLLRVAEAVLAGDLRFAPDRWG